jgi:hypothetical protein
MPEKNISYQLQGLEVIDVLMNRKPEGFKGEHFQYDISSENRVNPERESIIIFFTINIREFEKTEVLAKIVIATVFRIIDFKEHITKIDEQNIFDIPLTLQKHLASIAISTARGIMFMQFKGTYLHKAILPIILLEPKNQEQKSEEIPKS